MRLVPGLRIDMTIYVLANVATLLLSRLAGTLFGIVARLDTVRCTTGDNRPIP